MTRPFFLHLKDRREQWGFLLLTLLCISVIVGTALWTQQTEFRRVSPTAPITDDISAAQLLQQSLANAATPTPYPVQTAAPLEVTSPLKTLHLLRDFDNSTMQRSAIGGLWVLHDAADYACAEGETVFAMADGVVTGCATEGIYGAYVEIAHENGLLVRYAGLGMINALRVGDPVRAGQTIGFGGGTMLAESDLPPHLHLRITRSGEALDPEQILAE